MIIVSGLTTIRPHCERPVSRDGHFSGSTRGNARREALFFESTGFSRLFGVPIYLELPTDVCAKDLAFQLSQRINGLTDVFMSAVPEDAWKALSGELAALGKRVNVWGVAVVQEKEENSAFNPWRLQVTKQDAQNAQRWLATEPHIPMVVDFTSAAGLKAAREMRWGKKSTIAIITSDVNVSSEERALLGLYTHHQEGRLFSGKDGEQFMLRPL